MPIRVIVTRDFDHMSKVAGVLSRRTSFRRCEKKKEYVLGLAHWEFTYRIYRHLCKRQPTPANSTAAESQFQSR